MGASRFRLPAAGLIQRADCGWSYPRPRNLPYNACHLVRSRAFSRGVSVSGTRCGACGSRSQRDSRAASEPPPGATMSPRQKLAVVGSLLRYRPSGLLERGCAQALGRTRNEGPMKRGPALETSCWRAVRCPRGLFDREPLGSAPFGAPSPFDFGGSQNRKTRAHAPRRQTRSRSTRPKPAIARPRNFR